jgi:hypothetical protein
MSHSKRSANSRRRTQRRSGKSLSVREKDFLLALWTACECQAIGRIVKNSYVLSRGWSWFSQIQWSPELRVPVPRFLTQRDP